MGKNDNDKNDNDKRLRELARLNGLQAEAMVELNKETIALRLLLVAMVDTVGISRAALLTKFNELVTEYERSSPTGSLGLAASNARDLIDPPTHSDGQLQ